MSDKEVIEMFGTRRLAGILGVPPSYVAQWKKRGIPFPKRIDVLNAMHPPHPDPEAFMRGVGRL